MSAITEVEWEACLLEPLQDREIERRFRKETGRPPDVVRFFVGSAWCSDALITMSALLQTQVHIDSDLADFVGLVVSQDNSCRFCFGATRAFLRILGLPESRIRELELDLHTADVSEEVRAALDLSRKLSRSNPLASETDLKALRALGYRDIEIVELASVIAMHVFFNRAATLIALPPQRVEALPDMWYVRAFRPLVKFGLRGVRKREEPVQLEAQEERGPFSHAVLALDGLPLARELRRLLDLMWTSALLPPRTVGLIFAVVARALGCKLSEREAVALVQAEGMSLDEIEQILTHLSSPVLDPVERVVVPFARETIWYQPAQIQRRGRAALEQLSREQFLEFVLIASFANLVCRLGVLSGDCQ